MRFRARVVLYGGALLLAVAAAIVMTGGDRTGEESDTPGLPALPSQDLTLNNIHHVATQDGVTEWTLDAESAQYQRTEKKTVFRAVTATFFLKGGHKVHLQGDDGILMTETKDMQVSGHVVLDSGAYRLNTEKLTYRHGDRTISTETPVTIKGKLMTAAGGTMSFGLDSESLVLSDGVEAFFSESVL